MKLQLALDDDLTHSLAVLDAARAFVDIVEIGTPLIYREGMHAVRAVRERCPDLPLNADLKIMDAGEQEAAIAFAAGCAIVTLLGVTQDVTVRGALEAAKRCGGAIMVDMMQVSDPVQRTRELLTLGCHYICIHTAHDLQTGALDALSQKVYQLRSQLSNVPLVLAGGIGPDTIGQVVAFRPEIVVVGGAITRAADPGAAAAQLHQEIQQAL